MSQKIIYFFLSILFISETLAITIDGDLSDEEWSDAKILDGVTHIMRESGDMLYLLIQLSNSSSV